jgi:D-arabinose 1-dehydrogenase-like Zn-dependent alcohol dehydrogenase
VLCAGKLLIEASDDVSPDELSSVAAAPLLCADLTTFSGLRNAGASQESWSRSWESAGWGAWPSSAHVIWASRWPATGDATLKFSVLTGVAAMVETMPLEKAPEAYAKMMSGKARFRMTYNEFWNMSC